MAFRKKAIQAQSGPKLPTVPPSEIPYVGAAVAQHNAGLLTFEGNPNADFVDYRPATAFQKVLM